MPTPTYPAVTVATALSNASASTGVPLPILNAIAQNETSYGQNPNIPAVGASGEVGLMQMTPIAVAQVNEVNGNTALTSDSMNDPNVSALAGAQYISYLTTYYNGDTNAAIAAYNLGQPAVNSVISQQGSVTPATLAASGYNSTATYLQNAKNVIGSPGSLGSSQPVPPTSSVAIAQSNPTTNTQVQAGNPEPDPIAASPVPLTPQSVTAAQTTNPALTLVNPAGLNVLPWYQDTNLLTGNPRLHKNGGFPLVFEVYMDQDNVNSLLTSTGTSSGTPITIPLNCSLEKFNVSSHHVFNKKATRTGFQLTMWGMAADTITGSGSTGVFLNQFGLTDFLSLAGTNSDAVSAVMGAFDTSPSGVNVTEVAVASGNPAQPATPLVAQAVALNAVEAGGNAGELNSAEPFRIAAEDAFIEFLSLFKMNGVTWLHSTDTSTSPTAVYSAGVGATDFEIKARNNDVFKRGFVVMKFRNSQYLGFFRSLTWVMDAENPYQWKFNFVFQVERTLTLVYYATPSPAPSLGNATLASSGVNNI